jgi:hypothetical protein
MTDSTTTSTTIKEQRETPTLQRRIPENLQENPTEELHNGKAAELCGEKEMRNPQAMCMVAEKEKTTQQPAPRSHYPTLPRDHFEHANEENKDWYKTLVTPATVYTNTNEEVSKQAEDNRTKDNRTASKKELTENDNEGNANEVKERTSTNQLVILLQQQIVLLRQRKVILTQPVVTLTQQLRVVLLQQIVLLLLQL